jgi:hypothetical protein
MDIIDSCSKLMKTVQKFFRLNCHEMDIKRLFAILCNILQDRKTERDVRDKHAVHNIEMKPIGLTAVNHLQILTKVSKIGRQK